MAQQKEMTSYLAQQLGLENFRDYGPNGLQIEGKSQIHKLVSGVTASLELIEAAIEHGADGILVHHGLFWRGQDGCITGWLKRRIERLLAHQINLWAYHLPLDAHPEWGNNAQLGLKLGFLTEGRFGEQKLGFLGRIKATPMPFDAMVDHIQRVLSRQVIAVAGDGRPLRRVAWCSGGAQAYFEGAIAAGADLFITGEISEPQAHLARETGVAFVAAGHHATERYGAPALAAHVAQRFSLEHQLIDLPNPA